MNKSVKKFALYFGAIIFILLLSGAGFFAYAWTKILSARSQSLAITIDGLNNYTITPTGFGAVNPLEMLKNFALGKTLYDTQKLHTTIAELAKNIDHPAQNYNILLTGKTVGINANNSPGLILDQDDAFHRISTAYQNHQSSLNLQTIVDPPTVTLDGAEQAAQKAQNILQKDLLLSYQNKNIDIPTTSIANWLITKPSGQNLVLSFDQTKMNDDLQKLIGPINSQPQQMVLAVENNVVQNYQPPADGISIDLPNTITNLITALSAREDQQKLTNEQPITIQAKVVKASLPDEAKNLGIQEIVGTATTTFTGSPKGRIANIKVGAKKLNGVLIAPNEEFSTVKTLGEIGPTTGYIPELSIIGNQTIPEYGGGLCQVATTLFRSVLNTGLPITARQNHSYRVSYYEKDGDGKYIGPGLDATIYDPSPDFRFTNDTGHYLLLTSAVNGDRLSFTFYGTLDGRKITLDGPHKLSQTPSGPTIYQETDKLPVGTTQRVEVAHPGGQAIATYTVLYADGSTKQQVFHSDYRPWPEKILVGTGTATAVNPAQLVGAD